MKEFKKYVKYTFPNEDEYHTEANFKDDFYISFIGNLTGLLVGWILFPFIWYHEHRITRKVYFKEVKDGKKKKSD